MKNEQAELEASDIQGRIAWAAAVRPALNELIFVLRFLGKKQVTPDDRSYMKEADRLIEILHKKLDEAPEVYMEDLGPDSSVGCQRPLPAFRCFRNAIRQISKEIRYLRVDRMRQGDSDWSKWLREVSYMRSAYRDLSDFLHDFESVVYEARSTMGKGSATSASSGFDTEDQSEKSIEQIFHDIAHKIDNKEGRLARYLATQRLNTLIPSETLLKEKDPLTGAPIFKEGSGTEAVKSAVKLMNGIVEQQWPETAEARIHWATESYGRSLKKKVIPVTLKKL